MTTIGILDSGIGGLTTLKLLKQRFPFLDFYYLADNKNMPYGTKTQEELQEICYSALKKLKAHSDVQVTACNTASSILEDSSVIKLIPPVLDVQNTLYLATPMTICKLKERAKNAHILQSAVFADTPDLATLVEVYASVAVRKSCLNLRELLPYLAHKLFEFKGVQNVVLGCSHYVYLKNEISKILGNVNYFDGNERIINALEKTVCPEKRLGSTSFDFTADDESKKYSALLSLLEQEKAI